MMFARKQNSKEKKRSKRIEQVPQKTTNKPKKVEPTENDKEGFLDLYSDNGVPRRRGEELEPEPRASLSLLIHRNW